MDDHQTRANEAANLLIGFVPRDHKDAAHQLVTTLVREINAMATDQAREAAQAAVDKHVKEINERLAHPLTE